MREFKEILNEGKYSGVLPDNPTDEDKKEYIKYHYNTTSGSLAKTSVKLFLGMIRNKDFKLHFVKGTHGKEVSKVEILKK